MKIQLEYGGRTSVTGGCGVGVPQLLYSSDHSKREQFLSASASRVALHLGQRVGMGAGEQWRQVHD